MSFCGSINLSFGGKEDNQILVRTYRGLCYINISRHNNSINIKNKNMRDINIKTGFSQEKDEFKLVE